MIPLRVEVAEIQFMAELARIQLEEMMAKTIFMADPARIILYLRMNLNTELILLGINMILFTDLPQDQIN